MTHLERVLSKYIPKDKIKAIRYEIMKAVVLDLQRPVTIQPLDGSESFIVSYFPPQTTQKEIRK